MKNWFHQLSDEPTGGARGGRGRRHEALEPEGSKELGLELDSRVLFTKSCLNLFKFIIIHKNKVFSMQMLRSIVLIFCFCSNMV